MVKEVFATARPRDALDKVSSTLLLPGWSWWLAQCWLAVVVEREVVVGQR